MAYLSDGSRVCDSSRVALAAINADVTLTDNTVPVIYCAAIDGAAGDRMRADASGSFTLHWRRAGGTFAAITNATEVKIAATGTVLENITAVSATTARCNETATFIAGGQEIEGLASSTTSPLIELRDDESAEWQIALDFSDALSAQAYDFRGVVVHDGGTTNIDYASGITTTTAVATIDQEGYRHRNDDQDEASATWSAAQDTTVNLAPETPKRLRVLVNATGNPTSQQFQLEYRKVGDASWRTV